MKTIFRVAVIYFILTAAAAAQYWQQDVLYRIEAVIDDSTHIISARQQLTYANNSPDTLKILYFRAAANSFQPGSPLQRKDEALGRNRFNYADSADYGYTRILSLTEDSLKGSPLIYYTDYSIISVMLSRPIPPAESRDFFFTFSTKLPSDRLGYRLNYMNGQYKAAHWYPQICVYDRIEGWVNNQYLGWGENYGDIGCWEVNVTLPSQYLVAATGVLLNEDEVFPDSLKKISARENFISQNKPDLSFLKGSAKTWRFKAEKVCDFVFVADDQWCYEETEWEGLKVKAYPRIEHAAQWHDAAQIGMDGIKFYCQNFGRYPYPQMSITDSWSGMEYPMLVMCSGQSPEYYLLFWHEIAHNYFMGAVATNQTDRAFLDEGFTTFLEIAAMEHFLGRDDNLNRKDTAYKRRFLPYDEDRLHRGFRPYLTPALQGYTIPMPLNADKAPEWMIYRSSSYYKPVCMLFALEYMFGRETLFKCIREYYQSWRFKHPYEMDMADSFEKSAQAELTWFFLQWIYTDKKLDYAVKSVYLTKKEKNLYTYKIQLERVGEMVMPLRLQAKLTDETEINYWLPLNDNPPPANNYIFLPKWDQLRHPITYYETEITVPAKIKSLHIDPDHLLADINPLNNRYPCPEIQCDALVEENFPPTHAYQIRQRPEIAYNQIDGLELAFRAQGSYLETTDKLDLYFNAGLNNGNFDLYGNYENPLPKINHNFFYGLTGFIRNGLSGGDCYLRLLNKHYYLTPPHQGGQIGFSYRHLNSKQYLLFPKTWDYEPDNSLRLSLWNKFEHKINSLIKFDLRTSLFSQKYNYSQFCLTINSFLELYPGFTLETDLAGGSMFSDDHYPPQILFYAGGWQPEIDHAYEFWGTKSLIPPDYTANMGTISLPGLYSLMNKRLGRKSFSVITVDLSLPPKLSPRLWLPFYGDLHPALNLSLFAGIDMNFDEPVLYPGENPPCGYCIEPIYEVGTALNLSGAFGGKFTAAFPLYCHYPQDDKNEWDFRWTMVFKPEFKY